MPKNLFIKKYENELYQSKISFLEKSEFHCFLWFIVINPKIPNIYLKLKNPSNYFKSLSIFMCNLSASCASQSSNKIFGKVKSFNFKLRFIML